MKKHIKSIIASSCAALAFGGIAIGTTFALFTSRASTNIQVESGIVNVEQSLAIQSVSELGDVAVLPVEGVYTNSIGGKTYLDAENNRILHLEKWAPGDKAVIEIRNINKSNVAIRSRFSKTHSSTSSVDLYDALNVSYVAYDADDNDITYLVDEWSTYEPAEDISVGYLLSRVVVTIEFPDGDNGQILFGDDNHDNQYQDSNCSIYFTQEAVQGNAYTPALIDILNEQLAESAQVNKTMFDALSEVELEANAAHYKHYVWDSLEDQFRYDDSVTPSERYFKVYKEAPVDQTFSIYAEGWTTPSTLELDGVGFDAGNSTLFTAINYVNTSGVAKTNTIRTNSGTLTINAGSDIVHHYGYADSLDIIAVAGTSYHEFGEVGYANIANGRLVVEEGSDIGGIFLVANNQGEFDNIKLGVVGEATLPALARADVSLEAGESKLVVEVQTLESSESVDPNPEYVWISNNGSEVDSVVSSSSSEIVEVLEPTAAAEAAKEESKDPSTPIDDNSVARINAVGYLSLSEAFADVKDGDTVTMLKDFTVTSGQGILVNNDVTLDLNGKTIRGNNDPLFVLGSTVVSYQSPVSSYTYKGHLIVTGDGTIINTNWDTFKIYPSTVLDIYNGTFSANKIALSATGGTINTYGGDFSCYGTGSNSQLVQLGGGAVGNFVAGNFHTPNSGCYGVFINTNSVANFGELGEEGPTFDTWRSCISTNGSTTNSCTISIYSGTFRARRNDAKDGEQSVIQLANATTATQTCNIYGGYFEQTGNNENRSIFNVRYSGDIIINIDGGTFVPTSANRYFNGVGSNGSGWPSNDKVVVTVNNEALPEGTQYVYVYDYNSDARVPEKDFEIEISYGTQEMTI